jgi:hypothetical protein
VRTKLLMTLAALFLGLLGVAATFLPQEILAHVGAPPEGLAVLIVQTIGALYLGFALLDWTARGVIIGGVYSRPLAIGNFVHFTIVAIALLKALLGGSPAPEVIAGAVAYTVFAVWFGGVLFTHPGKGGGG